MDAATLRARFDDGDGARDAAEHARAGGRARAAVLVPLRKRAGANERMGRRAHGARDDHARARGGDRAAGG